MHTDVTLVLEDNYNNEESDFIYFSLTHEQQKKNHFVSVVKFEKRPKLTEEDVVASHGTLFWVSVGGTMLPW